MFRLLITLCMGLLLIMGIAGCVEETPVAENGGGDGGEELTLTLGQSAKTSKERVTVFSANRITHYTWSGEFGTYTESVPTGKAWILVDAQIENLDAEYCWVSEYDFSIGDSQGYKYDAEMYFADDSFPSQELYQGQKARGKILFEVPSGAAGLEVIYDFGLLERKLAKWELED